MQDLPPKNADGGSDPIQLTPQKMDLKIRPSAYSFNWLIVFPLDTHPSWSISLATLDSTSDVTAHDVPAMTSMHLYCLSLQTCHTRWTWRFALSADMPYTLNVTFRQAEDYPVDLYYIMDLSVSMKEDKDNVARLGSLLGTLFTNLPNDWRIPVLWSGHIGCCCYRSATEMSTITGDFHLGFGSFIDKKTMPYVDITPSVWVISVKCRVMNGCPV